MEESNVQGTPSQQKIGEKSKYFFWAKILWLGANILLLIAFYTGFCSTRGKTINILNFIDDIIGVFSLKGVMWYYYLANFVRSIIYVIIGIKCALRFKDMLKFWSYQKKNRQMAGMQGNAQAVFYNCIVYFLLTSVLEDTSLTKFAVFACVTSIVAFAVAKVFLELEKDKSVSKVYLIKTGGYFLVEGVILFVLGGLLSLAVVSGIIEGLDILFSYVDFASETGFYTIYKTLVFEIMYAVLIVFYFWLCESALGETTAEKIYSRKKFMSVALVVLVIDIVAYTIFIARGSSGEVINIIRDWFTIASTSFLPIALLAIAENMVSDFPEFSKYKKNIVKEV